MQFSRTVVISAIVALATFGTASAEDFAVPIDLGPRASIDLTIERSRKNSDNPMVEAIGTLAFHYRQDLEATDEGYRVIQRFLKADAPNGVNLPPAALDAIKVMTFDVGEDLAPLRLHDLGSLIDSMRPVIAPTGAPDVAVDRTLEFMRSMSPEEAAASFLREQSFIALPQAAPLDLNAPLQDVIEEELPNGKIAKTTQRLALTRIDKRAGVAFVEFSSIPDETALVASVDQLAQALGVAEKLSTDNAPDWISRSTKCSYEMDLKTGLTRRADCIIDVSVTEKGKTTTGQDRWLITQTLAKR